MCWRCSCRLLLSARSPSRIKQAFAVPVAVSADQALHLWPPVAQCRTVGGVLNRHHHPVNQRARIVGTQVIEGVISNAGGEQLAVVPAQDPPLAASLVALRRGPPGGAHVNQIACADVEAWTLPVDQEGVAKVGRDRREEVGEVCVTVNEGEVLLVSHPVFELSLPVAEESGQQASYMFTTSAGNQPLCRLRTLRHAVVLRARKALMQASSRAQSATSNASVMRSH